MFTNTKKLLFRWRVWIVSGLLAFVVLLGLLPLIIAKTSLRDFVLNRVIPSPRLKATSKSASFGWFSPLVLNELVLNDVDNRMSIRIERLAADKSCLGLWKSSPYYGKLTLDRPQIDATLPLSLELNESKNGATFETELKNANVTIRTDALAKPVVDLKDLNVNVIVERQGGLRQLVVSPVRVFDHHELTPEICDQGLQLIAPILANTARVNGQVSLEFKVFRLPLDVAADQVLALADVEGLARLHRVETGLKNPMLDRIVRVLEASFGVEIPDALRVADDTQVHFNMSQGRVHHEGLAFFFPDLFGERVFKSSGSVGFDETMDIYVDVPMSLPIVELADEPIRIHVTGTLDDPIIRLPLVDNLVSGIQGGLLPSDSSEAVDQLVDLIGDLFEPRYDGSDLKTRLIDHFLDRLNRGGQDGDSSIKPRERLLRKLLQRDKTNKDS